MVRYLSIFLLCLTSRAAVSPLSVMIDKNTGLIITTNAFVKTNVWDRFFISSNTWVLFVTGTNGQFLVWDTNTASWQPGSLVISSNALFTVQSPLNYDTNTGVLSLQSASGSQNGYLSSSDWTTFNAKEPEVSTGDPTNVYHGDKAFRAMQWTNVSGKPVATSGRLLLSSGGSEFGSSIVRENSSLIGIGVTPTVTLDVNGSSRTRGYAYFDYDTITTGTNYATFMLTSNGFYSVNASGSNWFAGNVGIGTTAPTNKLDIQGTFSISSNGWIGGNFLIISNLTVSGKSYFNGGIYTVNGYQNVTSLTNTGTGIRLYSSKDANGIVYEMGGLSAGYLGAAWADGFTRLTRPSLTPYTVSPITFLQADACGNVYIYTNIFQNGYKVWDSNALWWAGSGGNYGTASTMARGDHAHSATYLPIGNIAGTAGYLALLTGTNAIGNSIVQQGIGYITIDGGLYCSNAFTLRGTNPLMQLNIYGSSGLSRIYFMQNEGTVINAGFNSFATTYPGVGGSFELFSDYGLISIHPGNGAYYTQFKTNGDIYSIGTNYQAGGHQVLDDRFTVTTNDIAGLNLLHTNIQTQINSKEPTITGTGDTNQYYNGNKAFAYLSTNSVVGLNALHTNLQTQINGKEPTITGTEDTNDFWNGTKAFSKVPTNSIPGLNALHTNLQTQINSKEPGLGNPATNGHVIVSTTAGVRYWTNVEPAIAPGTTSQYWQGDKTWQTKDWLTGSGNSGRVALWNSANSITDSRIRQDPYEYEITIDSSLIITNVGGPTKIYDSQSGNGNTLFEVINEASVDCFRITDQTNDIPLAADAAVGRLIVPAVQSWGYYAWNVYDTNPVTKIHKGIQYTNINGITIVGGIVTAATNDLMALINLQSNQLVTLSNQYVAQSNYIWSISNTLAVLFQTVAAGDDGNNKVLSKNGSSISWVSRAPTNHTHDASNVVSGVLAFSRIPGYTGVQRRVSQLDYHNVTVQTVYGTNANVMVFDTCTWLDTYFTNGVFGGNANPF